MNDRGQFSVDLLIAVSIFLIAITFATYYVISSFIPYEKSNLYLQVSAYKVAMLLSEDPGLNITNISINKGVVTAEISTNWEDSLSRGDYDYLREGNITRIGLAKESPTKSSYERCLPCCLDRVKVKVFFNKSIWKKVWGDEYLEKISNLIGLNISIRYKREFNRMPLSFNISLRYMNGTVCKIDGVTCSIGNSIPKNNAFKFERMVVICDEKNYEAKDLKRLVVYVW